MVAPFFFVFFVFLFVCQKKVANNNCHIQLTDSLALIFAINYIYIPISLFFFYARTCNKKIYNNNSKTYLYA